MSSLVKNLLHESLNNSDIRALYLEGRKYFPNLKIFNAKVNGSRMLQMRVFLNHPTDKTSMSIEDFKKMLCFFKLKRVGEWLIKKGLAVKLAKTTQSIYINDKADNGVVKGKNIIRISDHKKPFGFHGVDILVNWATPSKEIVDLIRPHVKIP